MKIVQTTDQNNYAESPAASLMRVVDRNQNLSAFGFREYDSDPNQFYQDRAAVLSERCISEFELAILFLRQISKIKRLNRSASSYRLKHEVEEWALANPQGIIPYVCNGIFIAAAINAELRRITLALRRDGFIP